MKTTWIKSAVLITLISAFIISGCGPSPEEQEMIILGEAALLATPCAEPEPCPECPECPEVKAPESDCQVPLPLAMLTSQFESELAGRTFNLYISLPYDYGFTGAKYPVIYVLDGDIIYGTASEVVHFASPAFANEIQGSIVVGIGYAAPTAMDGLAWRTEDNDTQGSNYENFTGFLIEELIPYIEANYDSDPSERTLVGHSLTATYALSILFTHPDVFTKIVASSPDVAANDGRIYALEEDYSVVNDDLLAGIYLSAGGLEETVIPELEEFSTVLESRGYPGLNLILAIQEGQHHLSVAPVAIANGLRAVNQ